MRSWRRTERTKAAKYRRRKARITLTKLMWKRSSIKRIKKIQGKSSKTSKKRSPMSLISNKSR